MNQFVVGGTSVQEVELNIPMTDAFHMFCRHWKLPGEAKRAIVCIPGTSGNAEFFRPIGIDLAAEGNEVYALDLRGFGNSVETGLQRGDTSNFKRHLQDLEDAVRYIQTAHSRKLFHVRAQPRMHVRAVVRSQPS